MALTVEQIIAARRPETDLADPSVIVIMELAAELCDATAYGKLHPHAVALLACHWLESGANNTSGSPVSSIGEGSLSMSFADAGFSEEALASTRYGQEYVTLRRMVPAFAVRGMTGGATGG